MDGDRSRVAGDIEKLKAIGEGDVNVTSRTLADDKWVVVHTSSTAPPIYYIYDRPSGERRFWFDSRPALKARLRRRCTRPKSRLATG